MKRLNKAGVAKMVSTWPYPYIETEELLGMAGAGLSIGVYEDQSVEESYVIDVKHLPTVSDHSLPVAWITVTLIGETGLLYVEHSYRRKGLAQLLINVLSEYQTTLGLEPTAKVEPGNLASLNLFSSLSSWDEIPSNFMYGIHITHTIQKRK